MECNEYPDKRAKVGLLPVEIEGSISLAVKWTVTEEEWLK